MTSLKINRLLPIYISIVPLKFAVDIQTKLKLESGNQKFQYGCLVAILKLTLLKTNTLLHIYISIVPLKFWVDIQSQTKVRVWKPKNPIWPPGSHFESDLAENQWAFAYDHHQHAYEIWNWNSKANLTYAPETMSSTDRWMDGQTDGQGESSIPPSNFVGQGYKYQLFSDVMNLPHWPIKYEENMWFRIYKVFTDTTGSTNVMALSVRWWNKTFLTYVGRHHNHNDVTWITSGFTNKKIKSNI